MWEQIRANRIRSYFILTLMGILLGVLGVAIAAAILGPTYAFWGLGVAFAVWLTLWLTAILGGNQVMLTAAGAREIDKKCLPRLFNVVEEMQIAAGLPEMPRVYLIESHRPNAFAVGTPKRSMIAVTTGLLTRLNRDELQGVIAHEIAHISNHDCRFMVLAGVFVGAVVLLSDMFLRGIRDVGGHVPLDLDDIRGAIFFILLAILVAIFAPIFAQLLYLSCSRKREYLADASAARFTRYPEGLASALETIQGRAAGAGKHARVNRVIAPMFIVNPLAGRGRSLWSTHPPTDERVRILRAMAGNASYAGYQEAYRQVRGRGRVVGASSLVDQAVLPVRPPGTDTEPMMAVRRRDAMDALLRAGGYRFTRCTCGTSIKIPPKYQANQIVCPSCGRMNLFKPGETPVPPSGPARLKIQSGVWQTLTCPCGTPTNVGPGFRAKRIKCRKCGRRIEIEWESDGGSTDSWKGAA
jgi:heat shock protein HtpX